VSEPTLTGLDLDRHLRDPARKQSYVTTMFEIIAPRYDAFTRAFSFGMDAAWKRELVDAIIARVPPAASIVDLACGTGDLALALSRRLPAVCVEGLDASPRMVALARRAGVEARVGDMMALPYGNGSADAVTIGYGLRNVPDFHGALRECARVLRPGGVLGCLDFARPENPAWRDVLHGYLSLAGSLYGWWWHGEADVYRYIARSIETFVSHRELAQAMREAGFTVQLERPKLGGGVCLHVAVKGPASGVRRPASDDSRGRRTAW
jgi:demethylmenaquinone methyltransferase/2-methoxy-6-polyprenyl-1,4-benzoquinol methylase